MISGFRRGLLRRPFLNSLSLILAVLAAAGPASIRAARPYRPKTVSPFLESWRWRSFPELSGKGVRCMAEGRDGSMWFGVDGGVIHYDGLEWKTYGKPDGLPEADVRGIVVTRSGDVWISTLRGISRFSGGRWNRVLPFDIVEDVQWRHHSIVEGSDGSIWAGLRYGVLRILKNDTLFYTTRVLLDSVKAAYPGVKAVPIPAALRFNQKSFNVNDVLDEGNGNVWIKLYGNAFYGNDVLLRFHIRRFDAENPAAWTVFPRKGIRSRLFQTRSGILWAFTDHQNTRENAPWMKHPRTNAWKPIDFLPFGGSNLLFSMTETGDGMVVFGGAWKIITLMNGRFTVFDSKSLPVSNIMRPILHFASNNALWLAAYQGGVYCLDMGRENWTTYSGLNFQCETKDSVEWFIDVADGVVSRKGGTWIRYTTEDGLMDAPQALLLTRT
ncbi:MAG TPA: hypothetical protein VGB38_04865, partial [bacterium]